MKFGSADVRHLPKQDRSRVIVSTLYPLGGNYGGLLQAYALQRVIAEMGFEVLTINSSLSNSRLRWAARYARWLVSKALGREKWSFPLTDAQARVVQRLPRQFLEENVAVVDLFGMSRGARRRFVSDTDAIVVGSDQVWRNGYADVPKQLLRYAYGASLTRISYAASFGSDDLVRFSSRLVAQSSRLAKEFDAISVREASGVRICRERWGVSAVQHVDPTFLLERADYENLINQGPSPNADATGKVLSYVLDCSPATDRVLADVQEARQCEVFTFLPPHVPSWRELSVNPEYYMMRPVEEWLQAFSTADFIVTDSFHGTVFSILFNKPFFALGNRARGMARLESLLALFGLTSRFVDVGVRAVPEFPNPDWDGVNRLVLDERARSLQYLRSMLPAPSIGS